MCLYTHTYRRSGVIMQINRYKEQNTSTNLSIYCLPFVFCSLKHILPHIRPVIKHLMETTDYWGNPVTAKPI